MSSDSSTEYEISPPRLAVAVVLWLLVAFVFYAQIGAGLFNALFWSLLVVFLGGRPIEGGNRWLWEREKK